MSYLCFYNYFLKKDFNYHNSSLGKIIPGWLPKKQRLFTPPKDRIGQEVD